MDELTLTIQKLQEATSPEDLFGPLAKVENGNIPSEVKRRYHALVRLLHEDVYIDDSQKATAREGFKLLQRFWQEAQNMCGKATQGTDTISFTTKKYSYHVSSDSMHEGGTCCIFRGTMQKKGGLSAPIIARVPHSPDDNDLMRREADNLTLILRYVNDRFKNTSDEENKNQFLMRIPALLESFELEEPGISTKKVVNTFLLRDGLEGGWYSLEQIRSHYPRGVGTRVMIFIWNRILEGLTLAHLSGLIHSAVTPNHVLIHPDTHMGQLVDWTASVKAMDRERPPYVDKESYQYFYPPEIIDKHSTPSFCSDIYMSAWCMVYVLGGDPQEKYLPEYVEPQVRELLNGCIQPLRRNRTQTAEVLYRELRQTARGLFGPPKFVEFSM